MDPTAELKALIEESKKLIVDAQKKNDELLKGKIDAAAFTEYKTKLDARLEEISAAVVKLQAPPPGPSDDPDKRKSEHKAGFLKFLRKGSETLTPAEVKVMTISDLTTGDRKSVV